MGRAELFAPGALQWPTEGVGILTEHLSGKPETRAFPIREPNGEITIEAEATDGIKAAIAAGKKYISVEFFALQENRTAAGVREIIRAYVPDVAMVDTPEYAQTNAEIRSVTANENDFLRRLL